MEQQAGPKLTGENWAVWKFQTTIILKGKGLYQVVNGNKIKPTTAGNELNQWLKEDAKAQELIVTRMEQAPLTHILTCESSKDMWTKLKSVYEKESVVSIHLLQQRFFMLEFGNSTVSTFISQLEEIRNKLKSAGEEVSSRMVMTKILMSLPEQYKHFRSAWESVPSDSQTLEELTSRLLIEEERSRSVENTTALAIKFSRGNSKLKCHICAKPGHFARNCFLKDKQGNEDKLKQQKQCTYCKKLGHTIQMCWFKKNKEGNKNKADNVHRDSDTNAFMVSLENQNMDKWYLDSGASEHMCWNINLFDQIEKSKTQKKVKVGNGEPLDVKGMGWAFNGHKMIKSVLSDVLYVPELKFNLFSASCALDKGYFMVSDNDKCEFIDKDRNIRAIATREDKLYKMHFAVENSETYSLRICTGSDTHERTPCPENPNNSDRKEEERHNLDSCMKVNIIESLKDWHCKLGHQNINHVRQLLRRNNIEFIDVEKDFVCEMCLAGKQHRIPFQNSDSRASMPLELVHADVCGPMEEDSLGGARYFLLFKDDFSSYRHVYFMRHKSEVKQNIEKYITLVERETGYKL